MIVKYLNNDVWGYIDNVRQAACKQLDIDALSKEYDETQGHIPEDPCEYVNGVKLPEDVAKINKAFMIASVDAANEGINRHAENLLVESVIDCPAVAILIYLEDCKEYDAVLLVTNQKAFLMNDRGQTIERLN